MTKRGSHGFTLIELSIVLVIIGLIVGGILVGQDLIKAAQIRATVTQLERYNTAANTFRGKYNGLPGDLAAPTNYFPNVVGATGGTGLANGNGLIESSSSLAALTSTPALEGETAVFWYELFQAGMISENITNATLTNNQTPTIGPTVLPLAKLGGGNYIAVASSGGINYWVIAGFSGAVSSGSGDFAAISYSMTPNQAFQFDTKIDDGVPSSGIVISAGASSPGTMIVNNGAPTGSLVAGICFDAQRNIYATGATATRDTNGCVLRINASF